MSVAVIDKAANRRGDLWSFWREYWVSAVLDTNASA